MSITFEFDKDEYRIVTNTVAERYGAPKEVLRSQANHQPERDGEAE